MERASPAPLNLLGAGRSLEEPSDADLAALSFQYDARQGSWQTGMARHCNSNGADFSGRGESTPPLAWWHERDDGRLFKPADPLADIDLLQELIRIVNEAQERDAEDERQLYGPPIPEGLSFQRRPRPDRRSKSDEAPSCRSFGRRVGGPERRGVRLRLQQQLLCQFVRASCALAVLRPGTSKAHGGMPRWKR